MNSQNSIFPFILLLLLITNSQSLASVGTCLSNCATCEPNNLSTCKGSKLCEWGFHDPKSNGNCELLPTLRMVSQELGERIGKEMKISSERWSEQAQYSTCQYNFQGKRRVIDIIGLFDGINSLSKSFTVTPNQQIYQLSFNLIRDEWLPFNDFLMIDISSEQKPIQSFEISYQTRMKIDSQSTIINCSGKKVINQKYNIKIINSRKNIGQEITFIFTGFLFMSNWGISNIKLLEGCYAFTQYHEQKQTCSKCDTDSYLMQDNKGSLWCQRCPNFCKTCLSKTECTSCVSNSKLTSGKCLFPNDNKLQWISLSENVVTCGVNNFLMGQLSSPIHLPEVRNEGDKLYNEIQIGFKFYYNPQDWNEKSMEKIKVKVNQVQVFNFNQKNLTNTATQICNQFKGKRIAVVSLVSHTIMQVSNKLKISFELVGKRNIAFGVQDVFIKSQTKTEEPSSKLPSDVKQSTEDAIQLSSTPVVSVLPTVQIQPQTQPSAITIIPSNENSTPTSLSNLNPQNNITFIPANCQSNSGMQLTIYNIAQIKGYLSVTIDKLSDSSYSLESFILDDNTLHICVAISQSFTNAVMTLYDNTKSSSRLLQGNVPTIIAKTSVARFDYISPEQKKSISQFSVFFEIFAWFGVIGIIIAIMLGYGVTMQQYIISLQVLFLHLYICTQILPLSFRETVAGLRRIENLNFFIPHNARDIQSQWMGNVIQNGPVRLSLYHTDINFSREFYPVLIINTIYFLWFCIVFTTKKYLLSKLPLNGQKTIVQRIVDNLSDRVVNFADQIWRYQFMVTVWFCLLQFHNFTYPVHSNRSQVMNAIFCICCFVCTLAWPLLIGYYCRKQYYQNEYSFFIYKFEDIYYKRIPQFYLPTPHHRVGYPLFKICKIFLIPCFIALIDSTPFVLISLIVLQISQILYAHNYQIFSDQKYQKLKIIQNVLFLLVESVMLILYAIQNMADTNTFIGCGFFLSGLGALIVLNSLIRTGYLSVSKYSQIKGIVFQEMVDADHKKLKTERVV